MGCDPVYNPALSTGIKTDSSMCDMRNFNWGLAALLAALLSTGLGVEAATITVQVQNAGGALLGDAVAFLESPQAVRALGTAKLAPVEIAQIAKQFEPRVTVVPIGTMVGFPNRDSVRHHVYSFSATKTFELKLYSGTPANPVVFDRAGIAVLGCNIHDNMVAWVVVVETPYYGRSLKPAPVVLANVPAGSYRLRVWHPGLPVGTPAIDQALVVESADATVAVRMTGVSQ